jgi:uncharacterized damage-inducible protein DinB
MKYHELFITEIKKRLIGECQERTLRCLDLLTDEEIWYRPNEHSNSVGNLVLHLCGNVTQWLFSTLGNEPDYRTRQQEFDERGPIARKILQAKVRDLMQKAESIIDGLTPGQLEKIYSVQGYQESGVAILIHITEHFSYHVGQMTYYVKAKKDLDTGYYAGQDLDKTR